MKTVKINRVYVRYVGTGVCWTCEPTGAFYMGERDELDDADRAICDAGGGYIDDPIRCESIALIAH